MASAIQQAAPNRAPSALGPPDRSIDGRREYDSIGPNNQIADKLRQASDILAAQGADPFRIAAYRRAAESIRGLETDLGTIAEKGGRKAIEAIPGVGASDRRRYRRDAHQRPSAVRTAINITAINIIVRSSDCQ
jgi:hypothetical protein